MSENKHAVQKQYGVLVRQTETNGSGKRCFYERGRIHHIYERDCREGSVASCVQVFHS